MPRDTIDDHEILSATPLGPESSRPGFVSLVSGPVDSRGAWSPIDSDDLRFDPTDPGDSAVPASGTRKYVPMSSPWEKLSQDVISGWISRMFGHQKPHAIGRFEGVRFLGRGGCGVVMLAHDPELGRQVALKMCRAISEDEMRREAQMMARLSHPNIVKVHEVGIYNGHPFFAMEYVAGINGAHFICDVKDWRSVVRVYVEAGRGLAAAHEQGVVHGDFKPGNVLIGKNGHVQVSDFGKSQIISKGLRHRVGTIQYMAPEVLSNRAPTPLADQWSFCVALWETLETVRPFAGDQASELKAAIFGGQLNSPWRNPSRRLAWSFRRGRCRRNL